MTWLVDTNVLVRLADSGSREHGVAKASIEYLFDLGESLLISAQVLVEFWSVATRPLSANGLGWSCSVAAETIRSMRGQFDMLNDTPEVSGVWLELVERCCVSGKHAHDARLAALLLAHGYRQMLTFNTSDFPPARGITATHPDRLFTA